MTVLRSLVALVHVASAAASLGALRSRALAALQRHFHRTALALTAAVAAGLVLGVVADSLRD